MKRPFLWASLSAALALFAVSPTLAQDATPREESPLKTATPALWKVADEDTTIYLFGTIHALPADIEWYNPIVAAALTSSDTLITEVYVNPADPGTAKSPKEVAENVGSLPEGTSLRSLLTPEQTATYEAALSELKLPVEVFDGVKPWLAGINIALIPLLRNGYSPDNGVESVLESKVPHTPRGALETPEFQFGIFDGLPKKNQIAFLMGAVEGIDEVTLALGMVVAEWAEGDAETLAGLLNAGFEDRKLAKALLYKRNANWAKWIKKRLKQPGTVFVAVGAGHLAGRKSVQHYLGKRRVKVERVQ